MRRTLILILAAALPCTALSGMNTGRPTADILYLAHAGFTLEDLQNPGRSRAIRADLRHQARLGNRHAQYNLGLAQYVRGDYRRAVKWYQEASRQGHRYARYNLGLLYLEGRGIETDDEEAARLLARAADQDVPDAQFMLGQLYYWGRGVEKDPVAEAHWYRKAAEAGHDYARYNLAIMYRAGDGLPRDPVQAYAWMASVDPEAVDTGDALEVLANELAPEQLAVARSLGEELITTPEQRGP